MKLTVKSRGPRKAVTRTANASNILIVGNAPPRLKRDLSAAGHHVEVAQSPNATKRDSYKVVIVRSENDAAAARSKFPTAVVMVESGDVASDLRTIEARVSRSPVATADRTLVAAAPKRQPIETGPEKRSNVVSAKPAPSPTVTGTGTATTAPKQVAAASPKPETKPAVEAKPVDTKPAVEAKPVDTKPAVETNTQVTASVKAPEETKPRPAATVSDLKEELYFVRGNASIQNKTAIAKAATWLTKNADASVVVEGHADPTGTAEANMALSQARAENVRDALVSKGIDSSRISVEAYGDTRLKYGRADGRNPRVSITAKAAKGE